MMTAEQSYILNETGLPVVRDSPIWKYILRLEGRLLALEQQAGNEMSKSAQQVIAEEVGEEAAAKIVAQLKRFGYRIIRERVVREGDA